MRVKIGDNFYGVFISDQVRDQNILYFPVKDLEILISSSELGREFLVEIKKGSITRIISDQTKTLDTRPLGPGGVEKQYQTKAGGYSQW